MQYFLVGLGEKRPKPARGISQEATKQILRTLARRLGVHPQEFIVTDVQRRTGAFYVVFHRESYRRIFMRLMEDMGVSATLMHGVPPTVKFFPTHTSMPPLTAEAKRYIEGVKFYDETLKIIREEFENPE